MQFVDVCALEDLSTSRGLAVRVGGKDVALFRVNGAVHALENSCRHAGASLAGGKLCGKVVTCPAHGWRYDVTTGSVVVAPSLAVATFPVRIADGRVLVGTESPA